MASPRYFNGTLAPIFIKSTPSVDQVVNVDTCQRYLSILEEFRELRRQLELEGTGFTDAYLQFSISRYISFLKNAPYKPNEPIPIDIAYVWHAHMLSPYRYYEDITYNVKGCKITIADAFPIYPLSERLRKNNDASRQLFENRFVSSMDDPTKNTNTVTCRGCKQVLCHTWAQSSEWRTDPNVILECNNITCTMRDNNLDSFALQELLNDLSRGIIKGNSLDENGFLKPDIADYKTIISGLYTHARSHIEKAKTIDEVTFFLRRSAGIFSDGTELEDVASDITKIINSTYANNPSIFSLDLVQAVRRLDNFMDLAVKNEDFQKADGLVRMVRRYNDYLHLRQQPLHHDALPSLDVDIAWHVHMLHPKKYRQTTSAFLNRIPDHDSTVGPSDLEDLLESTRRGWEKLWRAQILQASRKGEGGGIAVALKKVTMLDKLKKSGGSKVTTTHFTVSNSDDAGSSLDYVASSYTLPEEKNPSLFHSLAVPTISYHNWRTTRKYIVTSIPIENRVPKEIVSHTQETILRDIKGTGYGYIGTVPHNVLRKPDANPKRIKAVAVVPTPPPPPPISRVGCIGPGSAIYEIDHTAYSGRNGYTGKWTSNIGGKMYRKYSRRYQQYGWTSNGIDWYSDDQCNFVLPNYGEFNGLYFMRIIPPLPSSDGSRASFSDRSGRSIETF